MKIANLTYLNILVTINLFAADVDVNEKLYKAAKKAHPNKINDQAKDKIDAYLHDSEFKSQPYTIGRSGIISLPTLHAFQTHLRDFLNQ
ncbi:MAG: hypothetical protein WD055_03385 [Candidatus Dependentiae bacterium]